MGEALALAVLGLFLGRFLNLTIDRMLASLDEDSPTGLGFEQGLMALTLVPVLGHFGHLRGQPGGLKLFSRSLAVEAITCGLCGFIGYRFGLTLAAGTLVLFCAVLVHLAFVDLERSILPNKVVLPALPLALALFPFTPLGEGWGLGEAYLRALGGAGLGFGALLVVFLASRGGTGAGDVKLAALLGAMLGFPQIIAGLGIGFVVGGLMGATVLLLRLKGIKDKVPYGPALIIGAAAVLLLGPSVYGWYLDLFK